MAAKDEAFLVGAFCGFAVGAVGTASGIAVFATSAHDIRTEAVERGHAVRVASPDGTTEFRWLDVDESAETPPCTGGFEVVTGKPRVQ